MTDLKPNSSNDNVQEQVQKILKTAGLESAPMDPSSLMALQQMVLDKQRSNGMLSSAAGAAARSSNLKAPPPSAAMSAFPQQPQSFASAPPAVASMDRSFDHGEVAPPKGNQNQGYNNDPLLQQLQYQTQLMLTMQQQIQALHVKVDHLERKANNGGSGTLNFQDSSSPNSQLSDRSFNMSRTKIFMRPSDEEGEGVILAGTSPTNQQQQQQQYVVKEEEQQQQEPEEQRPRQRITVTFNNRGEPRPAGPVPPAPPPLGAFQERPPPDERSND